MTGMDDEFENDTLCLRSEPLLYIDPNQAQEVAERLLTENYTLETLPDVVVNLSSNASSDTASSAFHLLDIKQDVSDAKQEVIHFYDSISLLIIMFLLFLTIITIWVFKVRRFRVVHSTGLALLYGVVVGAVIHYAAGPSPTKKFYLVQNVSQYYECNDTVAESSRYTLTVGEAVNLVSLGDNFSCTIGGKLFQDEKGNFIQNSLLFDPELFFFALLPPIIFYAGYSLQKRHFFRNLGSLLLYAFVGTTVSAFIIASLMYGYSVSGVESENSAFFNITNSAIPTGYSQSIIPSLLFGSLISATDPVTVLAVFHDLHVDVDVFSLVFGESVMNDAVAIVLFGAVDEYADPSESQGFEVGRLFISIFKFVGIFFGSFVLGCAMGLLTALLMKFSKLRDYPLLETSMFVIMSYSTYLVAEACMLTGIVAVLFCGIMQSYYTYINMSLESRRRTKELFELVNFFAENFIFSYIGLSLFTYTNHQWVPGFILFSFVAIFAGRVVNIYILSFVLNLGRAKKINFRFQHMLLFAGLRGAIAFALAIRNTENKERQLMFTTTLCIVMITVLFCGGLTTLALQCLKIKVGIEDDTQGVNEDGEIIEYEKKKGNWVVSKWSKFDKNFLIPIFTHGGRPINEFCRFCPTNCITFCNYCKPRDENLLVESESEELDESSHSEDEDDIGQVYSFRDRQEENGDEMETDLGLGTDKGYKTLLTSEETTF